MNEDNEKMYALLIDADNISPKYLNIILSEAKEFGIISIRRIYGDWTDSSKSSWKEVLLENSITPMQQYTYTTGKNSSDSAMIIDAMDILYTNDVAGFILASSDSDFTRLAMRLREAGKDIIGMGESKTPAPFVKACRIFKTLDVLYNATRKLKKADKASAKAKASAAENGAHENTTSMNTVPEKENNTAEKEIVTEKENTVEKENAAGALPITSIDVIRSTIIELVESKADDDGWLFLGHLGNYILKEYPDFDCRNYGCRKFADLVKSCDRLEIRSERANQGRVKLMYARVK
ncbi:MAG: NYN domain-containing protein [Lachnospiraceae bacterium]|nr:NYN domain-containing protein [Lachnospiraceae bacterium]